FPTTDFSSYLLQAQGSGADVIGLANAGGDTVNAIKQASEFGITQAGQKLAALLFFITDVQALGAQTAQGLSLTSAFYWDRNDATREWSKRFMERHGAEPTMVQAGVYSGTLQYLKAVEALGSAEDGKAVAAKMKESPFDDPLFGKGSIRGDGRAIHDMYLYEVKTPAESTGEWDLYKEVATISGEDAFLPMLEECDFTKQ
ncbi:ABC transporter substrate-binding protein, partial [Paracoccus sp. UBA5162]